MLNRFLTIALSASVVLFVLELYALTVDNHYKYDFFFLITAVWALYYWRKPIALYPLHYALFVLFLVSHNLGVFGTYDDHFFGIEYDYYVHTFFGIVAALILMRRWESLNVPLQAYMAVPVIVLLLSSGHEVFELISGQILGEGEGVLFRGAGDIDRYDTLTDIRNNLFGTLIGITLYVFRKHNRVSTN